MKTILTTTLTLALAAGGVLAVGIAAGDDDDHGSRHAAARLADPRHALYAGECGACHLAYPAELLPAASWSTLMDGLAAHFGDDASLAPDTAGQIRAYLADHSASAGGGGHAERTWRATRAQTPPLRITGTDYFVGQHHEIPTRLVADNPEVGSFSRCESCHAAAERGDFDEHGVRIPGYGRWDD